MPQTQARDQHYVPSFLLARWATPPKRKGTLYELAVATGKVKATKPGNVSWQRDLYTVDSAANSSVLIVKAFLAIIEDCTADPVKNLSTLRRVSATRIVRLSPSSSRFSSSAPGGHGSIEKCRSWQPKPPSPRSRQSRGRDIRIAC